MYADGSCQPNPGPGAWAYRIEWPEGQVHEHSEATYDTTNNREELKAIREGLKSVRAAMANIYGVEWEVIVRTDSNLCIKWLTGEFKRNQNLDLYPTIDPLIDNHVRFEHVRGHNGEPGNERVDRLANKAVRQLVRGY